MPCCVPQGSRKTKSSFAAVAMSIAMSWPTCPSTFGATSRVAPADPWWAPERSRNHYLLVADLDQLHYLEVGPRLHARVPLLEAQGQ